MPTSRFPSLRFPSTSQTILEELKSPDAKTWEISLARFYALYYPSIYSYARSLDLKPEDAKDRTQDFFVKVVADELLSRFDARRCTRFRYWLMTCFRNLVRHKRAAEKAGKRGGGLEFLEYDANLVENHYHAAQLAHLGTEDTFDLMLARKIWEAVKNTLILKHREKGQEALVTALLPLTLMDRWPPQPMPTQEEMAASHHTTPARLKAFFNRTLKVQARRAFDQEAESIHPGISTEELDHFWHLLRLHGEATPFL